MNSLLVKKSEIFDDVRIHLKGERAKKVIFDFKSEIYELTKGVEIKLGIYEGERAKGVVTEIDKEILKVEIKEKIKPLPRQKITLIIAIPRPQAIKRIIQTATMCGVDNLLFFRSDKTQKSYLQSKELFPENYQTQIDLALEQAWDTFGPKIEIFESIEALNVSLKNLVGNIPKNFSVNSEDDSEIVLQKFFCHTVQDEQVQINQFEQLKSANLKTYNLIAIGPERGWTNKEVSWFKENEFKAVSFGDRVLKSDVATAFALGRFLCR